jgi:hypothetical protein
MGLVALVEGDGDKSRIRVLEYLWNESGGYME